MIIYTARITHPERQALTTLATTLRELAGHELTTQLATILEQWATAPAGRELHTGALDGWQQKQQAAWDKMSKAMRQQYGAEFKAAGECCYAARGAGMKAPQSFSENVADATRALSAAQGTPTNS